MNGTDIKDQRRLLQLSQAGMAQAMGVSLRQYHRYESSPSAVPAKIENLVKLVVSRAATALPRRDGRYSVPIDWEAKGKVLFVYQAGREVGHDPANTKDPSGRWRAKDEAELRTVMAPYGQLEIEERDDGWHVAIHGSSIPK